MPTEPARTSRRERLYLLDGMALAYRAYFSFISHPLTNSRGENTSAIFGFVNALMKILGDEKPEHVAVVFDTKEPTFRHLMYTPYKATRQKMPEDMIAQLDKLKEAVRAFNVPSIEMPGYEADDIMGTLARMAQGEGIDTYLVTADKDFMQLISPSVKMYRPGKRGNEWEILGEDSVAEKFGVPPEQVTDVLGLVGDSSDNVPGVFGVGEKSAIPLVQRYGSIENIYEHLDSIPQKGLQQKLREHHQEAVLSKKLVTIDTHVPLEINLHHLVARPPDHGKLVKLFTELEFPSFLKKLALTLQAEPEQAPTPEEAFGGEQKDIRSEAHTYHLVRSTHEFEKLLRLLAGSERFAFDTETTSTEPLTATLVGISFALTPGEAWYVPVLGENAADPRAGIPLQELRSGLIPLLGDPRRLKIGQNVKYDMLVLASHGIPTAGPVFDTMVASYILRPDGQHNMDSLAREHLGYRTITFDELTGTGKQRRPISEVELERIADYSAEDADITLRLADVLHAKLSGQDLLPLCESVEFPLIEVLASMEKTGVRIDTAYLADLSKELERVLTKLTADICAHAGETFNINSSQQLAKILFEKLKIRARRRTKTGFSTDVAVLEEIRYAHPVVELLLEYRQLQKLKSTYVDALPALIDQATGRVHTSFNQTVVATGRLSSSNPNLQNIPIRTELGKSIRRAFIPDAGRWLILSADYSQIELRIMAHVSADEGLTAAFLGGEDIHATTAAKVFGLSVKEVTKDMRRKAKEVNFGIMYGIGPYGLAARLDISQQEAKEIINRYFERFPRVRQYIGDTIAQARARGYVSTLLGRRRYLPDIRSRNFGVRSNAERQAINMPIQGTAADMIKLAMVNIHRSQKDTTDRIRMILQVHDELVFEVTKGEEKNARIFIAETMKKALPLTVPVEVDIGSGRNWLEAH